MRYFVILTICGTWNARRTSPTTFAGHVEAGSMRDAYENAKPDAIKQWHEENKQRGSRAFVTDYFTAFPD